MNSILRHRRVTFIVLWGIATVIGTILLRALSPYPGSIRSMPETLMQWLLLQFAAGVGVSWAVVTFSAQLAVDWAYPLVFRAFGAELRAARAEWLIFVALGTLAAVPAAVVLKRHGTRAWLWIVTPAAGYLVSRAVYAIIGTGTGTSIVSPSMMLVRFVIGLGEGWVLSVILRERMQSETASDTALAATPLPSPSPSPARSELLWATVTIMTAFSAIAYGFAGMAAYPDRDQAIGTVAMAAALSYGIAFGLLTWLPTQATGAALAFGTASLMVLPTGFLAGLSVLLAGFSSSPGQVAMLPLLAAFQIALAFLAFRAARQLGASSRGVGWVVGIFVPLGLATIIGSVTTGRQASRDTSQRLMYKSQADARVATEGTLTCLRDFHASSGTYPRSLTEIVSAGCEPARILQSADDRVRYLPAHANATGVVEAFSICTSTSSGTSNSGRTVSVAGDNRGLWENVVQIDPAQTCAAAWRHDPGAVSYCLSDFESRFSERGFPATLAELGPAGTNCLQVDGSLQTHSISNSDYRFTYVADPPGPDGRIGGFVALGLPSHDRLPRLRGDQTGVWRQTSDARFARAEDPPMGSRERGSPYRWAPPTPLQLEAACERGELAACGDLGEQLLLQAAQGPRVQIRQRPGWAAGTTITVPIDKAFQPAIDALTRTCAGEVSRGCRNLGQAHFVAGSSMDLVVAAYLLACDLGDADGCALAAANSGLGGQDAEPKRRELEARACELGHFQMCIDRAGRLKDGYSLPRDAAAAAALLDRACNLGSPESCEAFARMIEAGDGVTRDAARAERLMRLACAGIKADRCARYR